MNKATFLLFTICTNVVSSSFTEKLFGTEWTVVKYYNSDKNLLIDVISDSIITFKMDDSGAIEGSGGCNSYFGNFQDLSETSFSIAPNIMTTLKLCGDELDNQESQYLKNLQVPILNWSVSGRATLELSDADTNEIVVIYSSRNSETAGFSDTSPTSSYKGEAMFTKSNKSSKSKSSKGMFAKSNKSSKSKSTKYTEQAHKLFSKSSKAKSDKTQLVGKSAKKKKSKTELTGSSTSSVPDLEIEDITNTQADEVEQELTGTLTTPAPDLVETETKEKIVDIMNTQIDDMLLDDDNISTTEAPSPGTKAREVTWYTTDDPQYTAIIQSNEDAGTNIDPHTTSGLFCHRQSLFLCRYQDMCPEGKGTQLPGENIENFFGYRMIQWSPFYTDEVSVDGIENEWVQLGIITFGKDIGTCWTYNDWTRASGGNVVDVWPQNTRKFIACCQVESEQERSLIRGGLFI